MKQLHENRAAIGAIQAVATRQPGRRRLAAGVAAALFGVAGAAAAAEPVAIYRFGGYEGANPTGALVAAPDGYFYGTTAFGLIGAVDPRSGYGSIFRIRPDGSGFAPIHAFDGSTEGNDPEAPLIRGVDGALYGMTASGLDSAPFGTLFRLQTDGSFRVIHTFNGSDGAQLTGALAQDSAGVLYGTAASGGSNNFGLVFSVRSDGSGFKILHEFAQDADGFGPRGGLTLASDGRLYGTTAGDWGNPGTIYSIERDGSGFKVLHRFDWEKKDGAASTSRLVEAADGAFYGTTSGGGAYCDCGTLFRVDKAGNFKSLHSFKRELDGVGAFAEPLLAPDGYIYGTTLYGASSGSFGAAWKIDKSGKLVGLQPYTAALNLATTPLSYGADGQLYGTSAAPDAGSVYRLDPTTFAAPPLMAPEVSIGVQPRQVKAGGRALLSWNVVDTSGAAQCAASGAWTRLPAQRERKLLVAPDAPGNYAYTLTCSNAAGTASATATLKVSAP